MIVDTDNLSKRFGRVEALKQVGLHVPEGSAFALVGTNGCGKTTLLRVLVNILRPDAGAATVLGVDSRDLAPSDFTRIGYVSENQWLPERLTVAQYFDYLRALYPRWDRALEERMRVQLDLPPDRRLGNLSHGMRMKTVLLAGIAFRPRLLILDEPLSGMDTLTRDEVVEGLIQLAGETTILITSHEIAELEDFTSHVAFMDRGRVLSQESAESLHARFRLVRVHLPAPAEVPARMPPSWLAPRIRGGTLELIESAYRDHASLERALTEHVGAVPFEVEPMDLREISTALIRASRAVDEAAEGSLTE